MVVSKCKMRLAEPAKLNTEKTKIHTDLEWLSVAEPSNFLKTHNIPD